MKAGSPGPREVVSFGKSDHTVDPTRSGSSRSRHGKTDQPPGSIGTPRWVRYHSASASRSRARKKIPPRPVTREGLVRAGLRGAGLVGRLEGLAAAAARDRVGVAEREAAGHGGGGEVHLPARQVIDP